MARARKPEPLPREHALTSGQVLDRWPIARRTLYQWQSDGRISVYKLGSKNIYDAREIDALATPKLQRRGGIG